MAPLAAVMSGSATGIRESQNGMKYRTICRSCNSLLGTEYDPTIIAFWDDLARYVDTSVALPHFIHHPVKVQRLFKGVLGHLLAAEVNAESPDLGAPVRQYVLEPAEPLPAHINAFLWLNPFCGSVVIRDLIQYSLRDQAIHRLHVLKHFPVGFLFTSSKRYGGLPDLSPHRSVAIDDDVAIPVQLGIHRPHNWPEAPSDVDGTVTLVGEAAANAIYARDPESP